MVFGQCPSLVRIASDLFAGLMLKEFITLLDLMNMDASRFSGQNTLHTFTSRYANAAIMVEHHRRQHKSLMFRVFFSYGISCGLMLMILYLVGNNYPIPFFLPLLQGALFIYGSAMLGLGFRMLSGIIARAETEKFNRWAAICELEAIPFAKRESK